MSKVYLIKNINCFCLAPNKDCCVVELTGDDFGLILDALYENISLRKNDLNIDPDDWDEKDREKEEKYINNLRKVAKKFEKIFGGK